MVEEEYRALTKVIDHIKRCNKAIDSGLDAPCDICILYQGGGRSARDFLLPLWQEGDDGCFDVYQGLDQGNILIPVIAEHILANISEILNVSVLELLERIKRCHLEEKEDVCEKCGLFEAITLTLNIPDDDGGTNELAKGNITLPVRPCFFILHLVEELYKFKKPHKLKLKPYLMFDKQQGCDNKAILVFANNLRVAKSLGYKHFRESRYINIAVKLIRDSDYLLEQVQLMPFFYSAVSKIKNKIPFVVPSPPTCERCGKWGGRINSDGICSFCLEEDGIKQCNQ